jgi:2-haloacid dehalogenase
MEKYLHLDLYDDARPALADLKDYRLAILSNGSNDMLTALVRNAGLDSVLDATISIDAKRIFKPSPEAYALAGERLGVAPAEVFFVSSNPWDAIGAKAFGFNVAWIERITPGAMAETFRKGDPISPLTMFKALRMQMDELGVVPDHRVQGLAALVGLLSPTTGQRFADE